MITINPWINFNGNAEEAFDFYKSVLGGEVTKAENGMFISLPIGEHNMLIANNVPEGMGVVSEEENRSKINLRITDSKQRAIEIFEGLSAGGSVEVPMDEGMGMFMGMFRDKYGIEWIVEYSAN